MKVLQINCVFQKGSTGKITNDLHVYYKSVGIDSYVIYGRGEKHADKNVFKVASEFASKLRNFISRYTGNLYGMGKFSLAKTISLIKKIKPDVVHLQCINGYFIDVYGLIKYLKKERVPTLLTLHAEFMHTGNCGYAFSCENWKTGCQTCPNKREISAITAFNAPKRNWLKMKKAFEGFDNLIVVGVSDWVSNRAKLSPILSDKKIITILNGLNENVFKRDLEPIIEAENIKKAGKKIVLFVTPYFEDENKGGRWILKLADKLKDKNIQFVVIGKSDKKYGNKNITFLGSSLSMSTLAKWYSQADLTVLVSRQETFSMVCAESLCCGTPIVGFEAGAPELIALKEYSSFVPYGNVDSLKEQVELWLSKDLDRDNISRSAKETYSKRVMAENYIQQYKILLKDKK